MVTRRHRRGKEEQVTYGKLILGFHLTDERVLVFVFRLIDDLRSGELLILLFLHHTLRASRVLRVAARREQGHAGGQRTEHGVPSRPS